MSAVMHPGAWREPDDARRWPAAVALALVVEAALIGGVLWYARHAPEPPAPPMQIVLEAPKPAPKTVAPPAPKPVPKPPAPKPVSKPIPKPVPKPIAHPRPKPVIHHVAPKPVPPPLPAPKVQAPPVPLPDTHPAMPVAAPTPPDPAPAAPDEDDLGPLIESYGAALSGAIQSHLRYPHAAQVMGLSGRVLVRFMVARGQVLDARVARSSGSEMLDAAALETVRTMSCPPVPERLAKRSLTFDIWVRFVLP